MTSQTELAWAAAFLESEGSMRMAWGGNTGKKLAPSVGVVNTDKTKIERFYYAIGEVGNISGPRIPNNGVSKLPQWRWRSSHRIAMATLDKVYPYLTSTTQAKCMKLANDWKQVDRKWEWGTVSYGRPSEFDDMTDLWHRTNSSMLYGTLENRGIDYVAGIDVVRYASLLTAESMAFDFDLGRDLWLTRTRWTVLVRQYLDLSEVTRFVQRSADIGLGEGKRGVVTNMFCRNVQRMAKRHRWGNCMMAFTYRGLRTGTPTLTMHSRVSYIAYIGGADLAVAHVLAREIARRIDVPVKEFAFEWHIGALQLHAFKSLPYLYKRDLIPELMNPARRERYPAFKIIGKWVDRIVGDTEIGKPLEEEKYGPLRRVRRRYIEYINDDYSHTPSVPITELSLEALSR